MNTCANFKLRPLKRLSFHVLNTQRGHFLRYLQGFRHFSDLQFLSDLGLSKSVQRLFFTFLTKLTQKDVSHHPNPKFLIWPFLISWPWMTLIWHKVAKGLRGYLEVSQTRFMSFHRLYFNLIRLLGLANPSMTDNKKWPLTRTVTSSMT